MALELFVQLLEICGIINVNYRLSFYFYSRRLPTIL